ncbi:hypothetical protein EVAR_100623_1 [Eumeta japonica]|uniref:Uncharacterized protein n=1 Tax=Eumeta variegata TaxID=151549 RepID=A0A4C1ZU53_EUMVA|nr:hypothetical protein EVAR_100623_1 [Eumeta japonica]
MEELTAPGRLRSMLTTPRSLLVLKHTHPIFHRPIASSLPLNTRISGYLHVVCNAAIHFADCPTHMKISLAEIRRSRRPAEGVILFDSISCPCIQILVHPPYSTDLVPCEGKTLRKMVYGVEEAVAAYEKAVEATPNESRQVSENCSAGGASEARMG